MRTHSAEAHSGPLADCLPRIGAPRKRRPTSPSRSAFAPMASFPLGGGYEWGGARHPTPNAPNRSETP
eukprot:3174815-Alexandrium_andersonii.AAC.1